MGITAIVRAKSGDSEALLRSADRRCGGMDTGKLTFKRQALFSWEDDASTLSETHFSVAFFLTVSAKDDFIRVRQEGANLTRWQFDRLGATLGNFEQTPSRTFLSTRDGSTG
jgi:hypothetical protein